MSRNNDVFQVLVTSGNQAVLGPDLTLSDLAPGQIGFFSFETNLSIDGSIKQDARNFYMAVGVDDGAGGLGDVVKSSGTHIQARNVTAYTTRCYTPSQPKIVDLYGFTANCDTEYAIKFELQNEQIFKNYGHNQLTKTFVVTTGCCEGCEDCPSGDCIELAKLVVAEVNADADQLITATFVDYTTPATPVAIPDIDVWALANPDECPGIRFTTSAAQITTFCNVNLKYYYPRETNIIASLPETDTGNGFSCNGTLVDFQDIVYPEGLGYDIAQQEYIAGGWNGKPGPYRALSLAGVVQGFQSFAIPATGYLQLNLTYDQESVGGWLEYKNNLNTLVAIPCADAATRDSVVPVLDTIMETVNNGYGPLADDVAACAACGTVNTTSEIDDSAADGIG